MHQTQKQLRWLKLEDGWTSISETLYLEITEADQLTLALHLIDPRPFVRMIAERTLYLMKEDL